MISVLLLPLLFTSETGVATPAVPLRDDPPIQLWISDDRRFLSGDRAKVQVRTEEDGYLLVVHVDPEGYLRVLFPIDPDKDNFVRGGKKYEVRGRGDREAFETDAKGRGTVYAAVSREPFRSLSSTSWFAAWLRATSTTICSTTMSLIARPMYPTTRLGITDRYTMIRGVIASVGAPITAPRSV